MSTTTQELSADWWFKQADESSDEEWLPVSKVPTVVHVDLQENGKIADPFINMNELSARWVAEKSWIYKTTFKASSSSTPGTTSDLVFKGLDTFATVRLNGKVVLEASNMFLEYRVNVTERLQEANVLEITFDSALLRGRQLIKEHEHEHRFIAHQTENSRLPVRKAQCHWGWDWGPILITAGPWRPVYLESYASRIEDVWFQAEVSRDLSKVGGKLFATVDSAGGEFDKSSHVRFSLALEKEVVLESQAVIVDNDGLAAIHFELDSPSLWYPHGYGRQARYSLRAVLIHGDSVQDSKSKLVGFRKIELIQEKDEYGKSFYLRINNVDVFAGGSCWIPADSFIPRIGQDGYRKWLELMVEGNQIMTRIWGGGIYEEDVFFDICDELGILVWQDFAFACASYPTYPSFLEQIEQEARYNVRRLRSHPSLAIWAGNNEDYQIQERYDLDYDYEGDKDPQSWLKGSFPARYIYEHQLPTIVQEEDPGALYHPSSPWGDGKKSFDPTVGDIHQWNVWHGTMRRYQSLLEMSGRFVSEFGMEAYAHLETTLSAITDPAQQYPGSMYMDYHNRAIDHERRLLTYVAENFRIKYDLPSFTHLTQITQADTIDYAYRFWRRDWGSAGARKTGGVLVWQLNDCWPTMSWAVVDYHRVKKPAFYAIKRALKPVVVGVARPFHDWTAGHVDPTVAIRDRRYDVWVASSKTGQLEAELTVSFISIKTGQDIASAIKRKIQIKPNGTTEVIQQGEVDVENIHDQKTPFNQEDHDPYIVHASLSLDGQTASTDTAWPHPFKYLDFADRGVKVQVSNSKDRILVTAEKPVHGFVFQEKKDWVQFEDNGFDVVPGEERSIQVSSSEGWQENELRWTYIGADNASIGLSVG